MNGVTLVYMPFAPVERPSIAIGILKETLNGTGLEGRTIHAHLRFAEECRLWRYQMVSNRYEFSDLVGDWVFAGVAFPDFAPDHEAYFRRLFARRSRTGGIGPGMNEAEIEQVCRELRVEGVGFVDRLAREIVAAEPLIVGCSSAFEQHTASLALLLRVRELDPRIVTMMGGPNCESSMGAVTHRQAPWVDFVVSGEADRIFPWLCQRIRDSGREILDLPDGVAGPAQRGNQLGRATLANLDESPVPDYEEYFTALRRSKTLRRQLVPGLPVETSRGCWWGERKHCKFCGLNGLGMGYRSKSPGRIVEEFATLTARHRVRNLEVVDNILDMKHLDSVMPVLAQTPDAYSIFYETKANLQRRHLEQLAAAGVRWIQPGIESLHTGFLRQLDKGNTAAINVQLLRGCRELGIRVSWNVLCDLPGDEDAWYDEMAELMPALTHLEPPQGLSGVQFVRYSPYQERAAEHGLDLAPNPMCQFVYPWPEEEIAEFAYVFENTSGATRERAPLVDEFQRPGHQRVRREIDAWYAANARLELAPGGIIDTRAIAASEWTPVDAEGLAILEACDEPEKPAKLAGLNRGLVEQFLERRFLVELDGRILSLVLRHEAPPLPNRKSFPGGYVPTDFRMARVMEKLASAIQS